MPHQFLQPAQNAIFASLTNDGDADLGTLADVVARWADDSEEAYSLASEATVTLVNAGLVELREGLARVKEG